MPTDDDRTVYHYRDLKDKTSSSQAIYAGCGLYYYPRLSRFGNVPPKTTELLSVFLDSDEFITFSPNIYNSLGLGTTQLYNFEFVYNKVFECRIKLCGRNFELIKKEIIPNCITKEFLLGTLKENINYLAEDRNAVLEKLSKINNYI